MMFKFFPSIWNTYYFSVEKVYNTYLMNSLLTSMGQAKAHCKWSLLDDNKMSKYQHLKENNNDFVSHLSKFVESKIKLKPWKEQIFGQLVFFQSTSEFYGILL